MWKRPGGTQQSFIGRGFPSRFNPSPFYIHFWQQRCPFRIPSINNWNGTPFTCSLALCIPFNCCKCTIWIWINHKSTSFSRLFHSHKMHLLALLGLFTDRNDRFSYPFIYLKPKIGLLSGGATPYRGLFPGGETIDCVYKGFRKRFLKPLRCKNVSFTWTFPKFSRKYTRRDVRNSRSFSRSFFTERHLKTPPPYVSLKMIGKVLEKGVVS